MKAFAISLTCIAALTTAQAQAADVNHYICRSADRVVVSDSDALQISYFVDTGILVGQVDNEAFHAMNARCVGLLEIWKEKEAAGRGGVGYCSYADREDNATVLEWKFKGTTRTWSFIHGTGKWKGINGGGKYTVPVRSKTQVPGTFQSCVHVTGTYSLSK